MSDVPCTCTGCGIMFADARLRIDSPVGFQMKPEEFVDSRGNGFTAKACPVCKETRCRLLEGPLFVPRPEST